MNFSHIVAYTFNNEKKAVPDKTDSLFTPGPTKYEPHPVQSKAPAWTISKEENAETKAHINPEPGKYEYRTFIGEGPRYTIGEKRDGFEDNADIEGLSQRARPGTEKPIGDKPKRKKKRNSFRVPGPGTYNPLNMFQSISYSIRKKAKQHKVIPNPEVGKYNLRKEHSFVSFCHKFDLAKRKNEQLGQLFVPGPQHYPIAADTFGTGGPKYSFSKTAREPIKRPETPGPGNYKHTEHVGHEGYRMTFFKDKTPLFEPTDIPGPGTYNPSAGDKPSTPSYRIPSSTRPSTAIKSQLSTPGPELYNPQALVISQRIRGPEWMMGKSNRESLGNTFNTPGPDKYTFKNDCIPTGPRYTISAKYREKKKETKPDPGKYEIVSVHRYKEPHWVIGREQREESLKQRKKNDYPGPGAYNFKDSITIHQISFPHDIRYKASKTNYPGPGQYRIPCRFDDLNEYTRAKGTFDPTFKYV